VVLIDSNADLIGCYETVGGGVSDYGGGVSDYECKGRAIDFQGSRVQRFRVQGWVQGSIRCGIGSGTGFDSGFGNNRNP
jgi:hypothetical protein